MKLGLIGAGNMARAMARGWGEPVLCSDAGSGGAAALVAEVGGRAVDSVVLAREADLVVLCHEPAQLEQVAEEIRPHVRAVASVLATISASALQDMYAPAATFRLLPNNPVQARRGVIVYTAAGEVDPGLEREVLDRFGRLGSVITVPERHAPAAAAVMTVGPAYQALLAEAQVDAAVHHGVAPALAARLVAETMSGTAALLAERAYDALAVRREVTSPGGSTARGLDALERGGARTAFGVALDRVRAEPSR